MAVPGTPEPHIIIVPAPSLPSQPWWKALHLTINQAFKSKNHNVFPPSWTRLPENPNAAAERLKNELGPNGHIAVVLLVDRPIACAGAMPWDGLEWIDESNTRWNDRGTHDVPSVPDLALVPATEKPGDDWELCCVCVHPIHRRVGLSPRLLRALVEHIKPLGARRLMASYAVEETGHYWPHMGFATVEGAGGFFKKGYVHIDGGEPIQEDVRIALGVKDL